MSEKRPETRDISTQGEAELVFAGSVMESEDQRNLYGDSADISGELRQALESLPSSEQGEFAGKLTKPSPIEQGY